jgi:threonine dehydrogenase-like Zn-dependent dehydrogenase
MEAHGAPVGKLAQQIAGLLLDALAAKLMETGAWTASARSLAIELVGRGGTISLIGIYGSMADPCPY